jgi:hypothetical protein
MVMVRVRVGLVLGCTSSHRLWLFRQTPTGQHVRWLQFVTKNRGTTRPRKERVGMGVDKSRQKKLHSVG